MKEKDLIKLGMTKQTDKSDESNPFHYYTLDITQGLSFISNGNDESEGDKWFVEFFDTEIPVRYYDYDKVKLLFNLIEDGILKQNKDEKISR